MDNLKIANILYNLCLDMDFMDYRDQWENDINTIKNELDMIDSNSYLYWLINTICEQNIEQYNLHTNTTI